MIIGLPLPFLIDLAKWPTQYMYTGSGIIVILHHHHWHLCTVLLVTWLMPMISHVAYILADLPHWCTASNYGIWYMLYFIDFWLMSAVIWGLYIDYSRSCSWTCMCNVAGILVREVYQYCKMYAYQCFWSHYGLHWVHIRYIYWYACLISAYKVIGICGIWGAYLLLAHVWQ